MLTYQDFIKTTIKPGCVGNLMKVLRGLGNHGFHMYCSCFPFHAVYGDNDFQSFIQINTGPVPNSVTFFVFRLGLYNTHICLSSLRS